jgi:hypothetical protein
VSISSISTRLHCAIRRFSNIGVTPMIGVNDLASEVFKLADAQAALENYAQSHPNVARVSM